MPAYVGLPTTHSVGLVPGYHGAAYLGVGYNPFAADGDPNSETTRFPISRFPPVWTLREPRAAATCWGPSNSARRDADASGLMAGLDQFDREAFSIVLGQRRAGRST